MEHEARPEPARRDEPAAAGAKPVPVPVPVAPPATVQEPLDRRLLRSLLAGARTADAGLSLTQRVAFDWALERAAAVLGTRAQTRVQVRPALRSDPPRPSELVFGATLRGGLVVALDLPAARGLADAMARALSGMPGTGDLSATELGLLESLALEVAHQLGSEVEGGAALSAILRGSEVARALADRTGPAVARDVVVGGRAGAVALSLPGSAHHPLLHFPVPFDDDPDVDGVRVALALPPFLLQPGEQGPLAAGDVVLLGATRLAAIAGLELVTHGGWRLSAARIVRDAADVVTVERGPLQPGDPHRPEAKPGRTPARVTLGEALLSEQDLVAWTAGAPLDLPKGEAPGLLHQAGKPARPVELVAVDGELGARVLP